MRHLFFVLAIPVVACLGQTPCGKLAAELKLPHVEITAAEEQPAKCVVKAVSHPTTDSNIKIEVWMPPAGKWNGSFQQMGNGGWAGAVPVQSMPMPLQRGYATAGTDDGHDGSAGPGASWAIGHPEKLIDFGHRAVHETSVVAKAVIAAYYGKPAGHNYFFGCSDGGREALSEAQRYPEDFEGIVAGAPANDWSRHFAGFIWNEQALLKAPGSAIPPAKLNVLQKAAVAACDAIDGVKDGLIEDPRKCHFNPDTVLCKGAAGDGPDCLTAAQVAAVKKIYAGPKNPRTGQQIYPGYPPGNEAVINSWTNWIVTPDPAKALQFMFGNTFYGQAVYEDPKWDFRSFEFDADVAYGTEKAGAVIDSSNPDLRSFRAHGGKLIQYHGWADAAISPMGSIEYYEKVQAFLKRYPDPRSSASSDFYRLYMVPGMGHCGSGIGAVNFGNGAAGADAGHDIVKALADWVEKGVAPQEIIATGKAPMDGSKNMTRPLCVYPKVAQYKGSGDVYDASNFACVAPGK